MEYPSTLVEAVKYFSDEQTCIDEVARMRWPDEEISCSGCGLVGECIWLANQKRWKCRGCKKQFSVKVGTIFHDSPLGLDKWMVAMWMIANCRNGVSSYEISRAIGITQKSAWHMMHRIRKAMTEEGTDKLGGGGPVEIDETFVGGKVRNMHKSKRPKNVSLLGGAGKTIVMGMLERGGKVRATIIEGRKTQHMHDAVEKAIEKGSHIITDEFCTYPFVAQKMEALHEVINHAEGYVRAHIHTNGIENFWSCLKRSLAGTYISVEAMHLGRYIEEQVFRFNRRHDKGGDAGRFKSVLKDVVGRRLTYAELTGRGASAAS